jgi:hypothetical protein
VKLLAAWQRLKAAYESEQLALEVQVSLLKLTQEVGQFVLALFRDDKASFHDDLKRELQKPSEDEATVIEHYLWQLERYADDQAAFVDQTIQALGKQSHEAVFLVDQPNVTVQKVLSERPIVASWAYRLIAKPLIEACLLLDENAKQTGKDTKDIASAMDRLSDDFLKAIVDAVFFEASTQWALVKLIADRATVTDDVDGAASAEDDQEIAFLKQVQHRLTVGDSLIRSVGFTRDFSDQALMLTSIQVALERLTNEPFEIRDQQLSLVLKPINESLQWLDQLVKATLHKAMDGSTAFDQVAKDFARSGHDALSIDEKRLNQSSKQARDALWLSDAALITPAKNTNEAVAFVDALIRSIGFIRLFDDRAQLLEALSKSVAKLNGDSAIALDRIQRQSEKTSSEQVLMAEASWRDLIRTALESALISSVAVRFIERRLTLDAFGASDALMRLFSRVQGDQLSLTDQMQRALGTALSERSGVVEQLAKHGNVLLRHGTSFLDRVERFAGKRLSDVVTMTDSGYWDQQSYTADPAFFAADYVGKRQFF